MLIPKSSQNYFFENPLDIHNRLIKYWFLGGCILIYLMVLTGGITRLTHSGLSIVNWNFILGSLPPISDDDWKIPFEKYKSSPEYKLINYSFSLEEFKNIFWWEYIHRFIGRSIGLFFIIPYLWFIKNKAFSKRQFLQASFLLLLGIAQGFIGWFMVKSGLNKVPHVSHFRLALHLGNAFLLFYFTFSFLLSSNLSIPKTNHKSRILINILVWIIFIQIILGAFVSGLKAGHIYNTFPLMGSKLIPTEIPTLIMNIKTVLSHGISVQFLHRMIAFLVVLLIMKIIYDYRKFEYLKKQRFFLGIAVLIQFTLGVTTLLFRVPILLGVLHQAGAFILFSSAILFKKNIK